MAYHKNLSGSELHNPMGTAENGPLEITDDTGAAYKIKSGTDTYFQIDTSNSSEKITLGTSNTNPKLIHAGTGNVGLGTASPQEKLHVHDGNFLLHNDSGGSMTMTFARDNTGSSFGTSNKIYQFTTPADMSKTTLQVGTAGSTVDAISVNSDGTFHIVKESSTPSSPGAGNGGYVYVKSDGKLYFRSDSTTETDITGAGGGLAEVKDDTSPQLGGNLDCNGNNILFDADTGFKDDSSGPQLTFGKTASAVNGFAMTNAATGGNATAATITAPVLRAVGSDSNIDLGLETTGTGTVTIVGRNSNAASGVLSINNETDTFAVNITVPLADELGASYTLTLPPNDGNANDVLQSDGSGNLSWVAQSGGGLTVESQNSNATLTGTNKFIKANSGGGAITLTLPAASTAGSGAIFVIKDIGNASTNAITLEGNGSETIDGALNKIIATNFASIEVICDGSNWFIR